MTLEELLNESVLPVVVTDDLGVVTHVNEAFSAAWGWTSGDLVGRPITTIIPRALRDAHHLGFSTFLATGRPTLLNRKVRLNRAPQAPPLGHRRLRIYSRRASAVDLQSL